MKYSVKTFRDAGLSARWTKTSRGAPIIAVRHEQHKTSYVVDARMWEAMKAEGIKPAFERFTLLGDLFSIPA